MERSSAKCTEFVRVCILLLAFFVLGYCSDLQAQSVVRYPFPLDTDNTVSVAMELNVHLALEEASIDPAVRPMSQVNNSLALEVAAGIIDALSNNIYPAYRDLTKNSSWAQHWFDMYWNLAFSEYAAKGCVLSVDRYFDLGDYRIYSATCPSYASVLDQAGFSMVLRKYGFEWYDYAPGVALPWLSPLILLRNGQLQSPTSFQPQGSSSQAHELEVIIEEASGPTESCYALCFDGAVPTWGRKVFHIGQFYRSTPSEPTSLDPFGEVLKFYRDTMLVLDQLPISGDALDSPEGRALESRMSVKSYERFQELAEDSDELKEFRISRGVGMYIQYVIDSDPFYFILYSMSDEIPYSNLSVDVIQRVGQTFQWTDVLGYNSLVSLLEYPSIMKSLTEFVKTQNSE